LLGVCALLALSAAYPGLVLLAAVAGAVVVALFAADVASGPALGAFSVERLPLGFVALLHPSVLRYSIVNRSATAVRVGIVETPVPSLEIGDEEPVRVAARSAREIERPFVPRERGPARFGTIYCWVENGVGFLRRRVAVDAPAEVRVFPDLLDVERVGALAQRRTRLDAGVRRLRVRGAGTEFESLRDYAPGDAFTAIDWKATAHRGRLTVAQFEIERSQQVVIVLDAGRLMCAPVGEQRKFDYALTAALSVARIATIAGDAVGLVAVAGRLLVDVAPRRGVAHHAALVRTAYGLQPAMEEPDYETLVAGIKLRYTKRSLIIVFTDLFDPVASAAVLASLAYLVPRHLVVCVLMSDAVIGDALEREPQTTHDAYRASVALTLSDERREAIAVLRSRGIIVVDAPAATLSVALIDAYLDVKARGRL
jgi:uncharacterized protein (DUF58 family)